MPAPLRLYVLLLCCLSPVLAVGLPQSSAFMPDLRGLTRQSGYIFAGTVMSVERVAPKSANSVAVMRVTFRVDQAIRGVRAGQLFAIHEWTGLWESGTRYRVGEHLLLFLYPPSRLGLTSPVSGGFGRFPMDNNGRLLLDEVRSTAIQRDPALRGTIFKAPAGTRLPLSGRDLVSALRRVAEAR